MKKIVVNPRLVAIDALRGCAIALMVAYHFCFDLQYYGWIQTNFNEDPFWLWSRTIIVSLFLCVAGISLVLANRNGISWPGFQKRFGILAGCAALTSVSSYLLFPQSWIFFGVLHFIAVASVLGLGFLRYPRLALLVGIVLIALGCFVQLPFFNQTGLQFIGLMTYKPVTEDYVPLLPWFGVVLVGMFMGSKTPLLKWPRAAFLAYIGRHSLLIYMLHQPLLLAMLYLIKNT
jgi:uncharacterized membrane protein